MRNSKKGTNQKSRFPHEVDGLVYASAAELLAWARRSSPLDPVDHSPLADAIRKQWPCVHPTYWSMIARRFRELYADLPEQEAVKAVRAGFSSPLAAMNARVIKSRRYIGFEREHEL